MPRTEECLAVLNEVRYVELGTGPGLAPIRLGLHVALPRSDRLELARHPRVHGLELGLEPVRARPQRIAHGAQRGDQLHALGADAVGGGSGVLDDAARALFGLGQDSRRFGLCASDDLDRPCLGPGRSTCGRVRLPLRTTSHTLMVRPGVSVQASIARK